MKQVKDYMDLPYTVVLKRDAEGDFVARIDELPGCIAHGDTKTEVLENLQETQGLWIADCLESGQHVPVPEAEEPLPSGKWVQRVPRSLHRQLSQLAKCEGVSLNQLVTSMLSKAVGTREVADRIAGQLVAKTAVNASSALFGVGRSSYSTAPVFVPLDSLEGIAETLVS